MSSLYHQISKEDVAREYEYSAAQQDDYKKAKWGSRESMENRFQLGMSIIDWDRVTTWLDIGCGPGTFFTLAEQSDTKPVQKKTVLDITPSMIAAARQKIYSGPTDFIEGSFDSTDIPTDTYDLITFVGVLQQCGMKPETALKHIPGLQEKGGQIFLTSKNADWNLFTSGELQPEDGHSWFNPESIAEILTGLSFSIKQLSGFLPRENRIVPLNDSHTFFIIAEKK